MKKILSILVISIFALSACGGEPQESTESAADSQPDLNEDQQNPSGTNDEVDLDTLPTGENSQIEPVTIEQGYSESDVQIFNTASANIDVEACESIESENLVEICKEYVATLEITNTAVNNQDESVCDQISDLNLRETCQAEVSARAESSDGASGDSLSSEEYNNILSEATDASDAQVCDQIQDENQKRTCYYNVYSNQAIQAKDTTICENLLDVEDQQACKDFVQNSSE